MKNDSTIDFKKQNIDLNTRHNVLSSPETKQKIVLAGNPNVGKSLFFNHFSGMYVDVSNFPGTTVSFTKAKYKNFEIFDTPGIYGVSSFNDEEKVARDIILSADIILNVVNALHLDRDLFLTQQLIDMGKKITVLLNFTDELLKRKIKVDSKRLSELLGVEVIDTSAKNKTGFENLDFAIEAARTGNKWPDVDKYLAKYYSQGIPPGEALLIFEGDEIMADKNNIPPGSPDDREMAYLNRRLKVNQVFDEVEREDSKKGELFNYIGRLVMQPLTGIPILLFVLFLTYLFIGDLVSQRIVDYTENTIGKGLFEYNVKYYIGTLTPTTVDMNLLNEDGETISTETFSFPEGISADLPLKRKMDDLKLLNQTETTFHFSNPIIRLFFGEFGVFTMTITYVVFLLFPLVLSFYFIMALLEDSGYLPRLATMLDRTFTRLGLNGRAVIPIMLGFGCVTMANITTRLLGTDKEKSIVTAILQFVIPCSAQLAVIAALLSGAGAGPLLIYSATIFIVLITLSTILNKMIKGDPAPLLLDLPPIQIPQMTNVVKKTVFRSYGFMKEAIVWFFVGALGVGILEITGLLLHWQNILEPITTQWLLLPKESANAFIMGMVRRDFGAAGLFELSLSTMQITVAIITITLFVPCIAALVVMLKERGIKEGMAIWVGTWITAFVIGGLVARLII